MANDGAVYGRIVVSIYPGKIYPVAPGLTFITADLFELGPESLGRFDRIYDRAALVALPPKMRARYAAHLTALLAEGGKRRPRGFG